jgi:hypothetical protein
METTEGLYPKSLGDEMFLIVNELDVLWGQTFCEGRDISAGIASGMAHRQGEKSPMSAEQPVISVDIHALQ